LNDLTHPGFFSLFALAAAAGGLLRFAIANAIAKYWGVQFPLSTLIVNSSGAFAMGVMSALLAVNAAFSGWGLIIMVGFLGSYTTVSSFSLQTLTLWQSQHYRQALTNIGLSFVLCLSLVFVGFTLGSRL
jgi:CrcB protein